MSPATSSQYNINENPSPDPGRPVSVDVTASALPAVPVLETGRDFALATLQADPKRAQNLFDMATAKVPSAALKVADRVSRQWLLRWQNDYLPEIDAVAEELGRPGVYFLSVNYEWGCTTAAKPSPDGENARLIRVLDWHTPGLGTHVMAAKVDGAAGPFATMTWPGYTGVLQAMAPGRFSAALNQAPMRKAVGVLPLDWLANRARVWSMKHMTPAHLLRQVFEQAADFDDARRRLIETPISTPAIFALSGLEPDQRLVIERSETEARLSKGDVCVANHWHHDDWTGADKARARGVESERRADEMSPVAADMDGAFPWLSYPILNDHTRLVMMADAREGRLIAQGYEADGKATQLLDLQM